MCLLQQQRKAYPDRFRAQAVVANWNLIQIRRRTSGVPWGIQFRYFVIRTVELVLLGSVPRCVVPLNAEQPDRETRKDCTVVKPASDDYKRYEGSPSLGVTYQSHQHAEAKLISIREECGLT